VYGSKVSIDGAAPDLPSMFDAFSDGAPEVNANQDPRQSVLICRL
jgi:hypothetical protein